VPNELSASSEETPCSELASTGDTVFMLAEGITLGKTGEACYASRSSSHNLMEPPGNGGYGRVAPLQ
jgi:hypothetical protein